MPVDSPFAAMRQIHANIAGAVGDIQIQDISRQQVEQVSGVLEVVSEHFSCVRESLICKGRAAPSGFRLPNLLRPFVTTTT